METTQESLDRLRDEVAELRASRQRLALAEEAERRSTERALHDGPQQRLVALAVTLQLARSALEQNPAAAVPLLAEVDAHLEHALDEAAALAQRIYPPLLESGGLGPALRASAAVARVAVRVEVEPSVRLPREIAAVVYFCCADLLGSVQARAVTVYEEDGAVVFDVVGNGELEAAAGGVAVRARDRLKALGGDLAADSAPGGSSRLRGSLPLGGWR